jgi:hypothetical protein
MLASGQLSRAWITPLLVWPDDVVRDVHHGLVLLGLAILFSCMSPLRCSASSFRDKVRLEETRHAFSLLSFRHVLLSPVLVAPVASGRWFDLNPQARLRSSRPAGLQSLPTVNRGLGVAAPRPSFQTPGQVLVECSGMTRPAESPRYSAFFCQTRLPRLFHSGLNQFPSLLPRSSFHVPSLDTAGDRE